MKAKEEVNSVIIKNSTHTVRRKKIWKGKMAPKGYMYLVIVLERYKSKYTALRLYNPKIENEDDIESNLLKLIKDKYEI